LHIQKTLYYELTKRDIYQYWKSTEKMENYTTLSELRTIQHTTKNAQP